MEIDYIMMCLYRHDVLTLVVSTCLLLKMSIEMSEAKDDESDNECDVDDRTGLMERMEMEMPPLDPP